MEKKEERLWKRENFGKIEEPLFDYLEKLFTDLMEQGMELKVCVGTDSQKSGKVYKFATVIVIETKEYMGLDKLTGKDIYVGRGNIVLGTTFWDEMKASTTKKKHRELEVIKQRMMREVQSSIDIAYEICPILDLFGISLEVHADVNPQVEFESNVAVKEAMGYINAMGWDAKVKPDAYAATKGADRVCK